MKEKRKSKSGRNPKLDPAVYRYTVRFNEEEHNRFLAMFGKSGVYARSVFLKAHFFGQPFKVLKVDKTLVDYYTKLSDFHAQFRAVGTNYNQVVKELRLHFSEKKDVYKRQTTSMVSSYFDPGTKLIYAIGAVVGLIGGVKVYGKFSSGDPDTSKTAASWFGACIFLIVAATILRSFFL